MLQSNSLISTLAIMKVFCPLNGANTTLIIIGNLGKLTLTKRRSSNKSEIELIKLGMIEFKDSENIDIHTDATTTRRS